MGAVSSLHIPDQKGLREWIGGYVGVKEEGGKVRWEQRFQEP